MKEGKKRNYRFMTVMLSLALIACGIAGGTVAWLLDKTDQVINTFTYGDIDLTLDETRTDEDGNPLDKDGNPVDDLEDAERRPEGNEYDMLPGEEYLKDPMVTVELGNEECWVFVKLEENNGFIENSDGTQTVTGEFDEYLEYKVDVENGWKMLQEDSEKGVFVYYRYVEEDTNGKPVTYPVLKDNKISVKADVTKDMLNALDNNGDPAISASVTYPSLAITAYAIQYSGFEIEGEITEEASRETTIEAAQKAWVAIEDFQDESITTP